MDDDGRIAAQFENDFLFSGAALDVPAHGNAAGKTDELDAVVGNQQAGVFIGERQNVETAVGPSRLLHAFRQKQRAERRLRCGLQDHGAAGGNRGSNFVGDEIDGEVKWRDAGDRAQRKAAHDAPAAGGELLPIERKEFAIDASAFFSGNVESEDGALDFDARGFDGLAGFLRQGTGKFFFALGHERGNPTQNALTFKGGQTAGSAERFYCGGDRGFGVLSASLKDPRDETAVIRRADFDEVAVLLPPAIDKKTVCRNRRDRQLSHDFSCPQGND